MTHIWEIDGVGTFTDRAEFEAALKKFGEQHPEKREEYAKRLDEMIKQLSDDTVTIPKALLAPFLEFIRVNDSDTLASLDPDEKVVATATGSWMGPKHITLGDIRALVRAFS